MVDKAEQNYRTSRGELRFTPALLSEDDAAAYLGISKGTLRSLGIRRKALGRRRLYVRRDLDDFYQDLPYEGDEATHESDIDMWFSANG